ncbi:hypothetical protein [Pseudomonas brassicacearum]|uniref:hypothetical protein n=1 Tax=Pseudomonas brassicacearum TaxID=930166 RepID=UPI000F463B35|nr:hypothetical protein [Pseudomonas brassicacearum]
MLALLLVWPGLTANLLAATGPEVAQLLNRNFQFTPSECAAQKPAHACSGVLARGSPSSGQFWQPDPVSSQLGAQSFTYLRADLGTRSLAQPNGVLLSDGFTAISQGKRLDVLCAYPFPFTLQANRPDFGCGWIAANATAATADSSSCAAQGVSDAQGWLEHFRRQNQQPTAQCSLSSQEPEPFKASLVAHEGLDSTWSVQPMQVQVGNWDASAPKQMPMLGLFYDVTQAGALLGALKDQRDYFNATGDWLPILRMDLSRAPETVFGFNLQDQLYIGHQVAAKMNARFDATAPTCRDEQPAFKCNGVLIRAADASPNFHAWNPSDNSIGRNGISFSYIRADVGTVRLAGTQGYTLKETFAPTGYPVTLRCAYPANAGTNAIPDSCRASCRSLGVITVAAWRSIYASNPHTSCAFEMTPGAFQLSIDVRQSITHSSYVGAWNEIIIAVWPNDIPRELPIEAFFYTSGNATGLANARFIQRDYLEQTALFLPIVRLNLAAPQVHPFAFDAQDQTVQGTSMQTLTEGITPNPNPQGGDD